MQRVFEWHEMPNIIHSISIRVPYIAPVSNRERNRLFRFILAVILCEAFVISFRRNVFFLSTHFSPFSCSLFIFLLLTHALTHSSYSSTTIVTILPFLSLYSLRVDHLSLSPSLTHESHLQTPPPNHTHTHSFTNPNTKKYKITC
jgi:hypothetical protein